MRYSKYNNKRTVVKGIAFDSQKESLYYLSLLSDKVKDLELQPRFILQEGFVDSTGKKHRAIEYVADFAYTIDHGETYQRVVVDCKGYATEVYKVKKKLFLYKYPDVKFEEV